MKFVEMHQGSSSSAATCELPEDPKQEPRWHVFLPNQSVCLCKASRNTPQDFLV